MHARVQVTAQQCYMSGILIGPETIPWPVPINTLGCLKEIQYCDLASKLPENDRYTLHEHRIQVQCRDCRLGAAIATHSVLRVQASSSFTE